MFSLPNVEMSSISPVIFTGLAVLAGTLLKELLAISMRFIPQKLHDKMVSTLESLIGNYFSEMTLIIDEKLTTGSMNEMFEASENYMLKRISPSVKRLQVSKAQRENELCVTIDQGVEIADTFQGIQFTWKYVKESDYDESKLFKLSFHKKHWNMVQTSYLRHVLTELEAKKEENKVMSYLRHVLDVSEAKKEENKVMKLRLNDGQSINLDHPSTFETLAMDPTLKKALIEDLDRFVNRKDFYRRVGKVWKRGYFLYGPPGTGKSSLIAAIANHLKFRIYDLELKKFQRNTSELKKLLLAVANKSILVIEDIDSCCDDFQNRGATYRYVDNERQLTLSTLLNFIDGLWSSCGDERIIIFTTNHKEKLDPAILRPGRMDMHIHMSYCTFDGFKTLASNYLGIGNDPKFTEIRELLEELKVTPAEIAEELMRTDEPNRALEGFIEFLHTKRTEHDQANAERETEVGEQATEIPRNEEGTEEVSEET